MKILFLDDEQWRHDEIELHCAQKHDLWHVWTAEDAIHALRNAEPPFDLVSLDHDLGSGKTEGREVSKFLAAVSNVWPAKRLPLTVVIHSWNMPAAQFMLADLLSGQLPDVVLAPFQTYNYHTPGTRGDWCESST